MRENWHKNYTEQFIYPGNQSWIFMGRTEAEAETPILWLPDVKSWLIGIDTDGGKDWGQEGKGTTEDEMVGWHHQLDGHEFEQALGVGDEQGSLVSAVHGGNKELDTTEQLNWTDTIIELCDKPTFLGSMNFALS